MILTREMLQASSNLKMGRLTAIHLLEQLCTTKKPHYLHQAGGAPRYPQHFYSVKFTIPHFLGVKRMEFYEYGDVIVGRGKDRDKQYAKTLAALEVVHQLEEWLHVKRGSLETNMKDYLQYQQQLAQQWQSTPVDTPMDGVNWYTLPFDRAFGVNGKRELRIDFNSELLHNEMAVLGAKCMTLASRRSLPRVTIHSQPTDLGVMQKWANVKADHGLIAGVCGPLGDANLGMNDTEATIQALERIGTAVSHHTDVRLQHLHSLVCNDFMGSFGMAKLFCELPHHQYDAIQALTQTVLRYIHPAVHQQPDSISASRQPTGKRDRTSTIEDESNRKNRLDRFRKHQQQWKLPIDSIEDEIVQHLDADVTIVRGGTGSGKTTRYPTLLSLLHPHADTRIVVAQPRRLACQAAARRVAFEQDVAIGDSNCPIGYSVRFESFPPSKAVSRTVDFETPGVLLRKATSDPLLSEYTHLCIDEVHERNAGMDLLLSLAKQAQALRKNHAELLPLRIVLMSATLDSKLWEDYYKNCNKVTVIDIPESRRFSTEIHHLDDPGFAAHGQLSKIIEANRDNENYDEVLCEAAAAVIADVYHQVDHDDEGGSILCFLPGIEEIRTVHRILQQREKWRTMNVLYLHSSLDSREQAKVFEPGPKVILATNIAETSITIPDVKVVVDSGRERQVAMLKSSSRNANVVGSQLVTTYISQASALQRSGRAGRVSDGTCYRLYTKQQHHDFVKFTKPEMLRMDLSQLILHSLSLYEPTSEHPLSLLRQVPDPPPELDLRKTLRDLAYQGLVVAQKTTDDPIRHVVTLTPLGRSVSSIPAPPKIGRMLMMGLLLRAIDPALDISALLSVPRVFVRKKPLDQEDEADIPKHSSDIAAELEQYQEYLKLSAETKRRHPKCFLYEQVNRVRSQLAATMEQYTKDNTEAWNANSHRIAAAVALICTATPHIAHLTDSRSNFATRDVGGTAKIHPNSVNFDYERRVHWYVYDELRTSNYPYLHITTAASPLELALFSSWSMRVAELEDLKDVDTTNDAWLKNMELFDSRDRWAFIADQWVPVDMTNPSQRETFLELKRVLQYDLLQHVAANPDRILHDGDCKQLILYILSAIEQQRMPL